MSVAELQHALGVAADGVWGPKSKAALNEAIQAHNAVVYAALLAYVADRPVSPAFTSLGIAAATHLPVYGIIDTPLRLANFLGQASHETGGFRYLKEIWGPTKAQKGYEGRADLGNTQPGDGRLFMGRGLFQYTGRHNYTALEQKLGLPLTSNPALLETPDIATLSACVFWDDHKLSTLADAHRDDDITRRINGGTNGIDERRANVAKLKGLLL